MAKRNLAAENARLKQELARVTEQSDILKKPWAYFANSRAKVCPHPNADDRSDRGSQYASDEYRDRLDSSGFFASMSRRGNCYDNATTESFWITLKLEWLYRTRFATRAEVESALFSFIDGWYNTRRLHSSPGYLSPVDFENSLAIQPLSRVHF